MNLSRPFTLLTFIGTPCNTEPSRFSTACSQSLLTKMCVRLNLVKESESYLDS